MKTVIGLAATAAALALAPAASAENINLTGNAQAICSLPDAWETRTNIGGSLGTFVGTTWTIPSTGFATAAGLPNVTGEIALRITGPAYCNTPHTISLTSANGFMTNTSAAPVPNGFSNRRQVKYDAHWADDSLTGTARRVGPGIVDWIPTAPGQSKQAVWAGAIPGQANFDIRLSVRRTDGTPDVPLVAGDYSDTVTVTVSPST